MRYVPSRTPLASKLPPPRTYTVRTGLGFLPLAGTRLIVVSSAPFLIFRRLAPPVLRRWMNVPVLRRRLVSFGAAGRNVPNLYFGSVAASFFASSRRPSAQPDCSTVAHAEAAGH